MNQDSPHRLEDIAIAAAIAAAMLEAGVNPHVTLGVSNSVVTLEGEVQNSRERAVAESVARSFSSVASVVNAIVIRALRESGGDRRVSE